MRQVAASSATSSAPGHPTPERDTVLAAGAVGLRSVAHCFQDLTDGDRRTGGSSRWPVLLPDIVKLQTRVADQQVMAPLKAYDDPTTEQDDRERTFSYLFDARQARGQEVTVTVELHLRHLPPYFLRALDDFYPPGITGELLLQQMVVSTAAFAESEPVRVPQVG
jgi:hypothetical protein